MRKELEKITKEHLLKVIDDNYDNYDNLSDDVKNQLKYYNDNIDEIRIQHFLKTLKIEDLPLNLIYELEVMVSYIHRTSHPKKREISVVNFSIIHKSDYGYINRDDWGNHDGYTGDLIVKFRNIEFNCKYKIEFVGGKTYTDVFN